MRVGVKGTYVIYNPLRTIIRYGSPSTRLYLYRRLHALRPTPTPSCRSQGVQFTSSCRSNVAARACAGFLSNIRPGQADVFSDAIPASRSRCRLGPGRGLRARVLPPWDLGKIHQLCCALPLLCGNACHAWPDQPPPDGLLARRDQIHGRLRANPPGVSVLPRLISWPTVSDGPKIHPGTTSTVTPRHMDIPHLGCRA